MSGESLSSAVRQFLARYIQSVEQLEVLLLLRGEATRSWTAPEVYEAVRSSLPSITERLGSFTAAGFLVKNPADPPSFRYATNNAHAAVIDEMAVAYRTWRVRVIEAIFKPEVDSLKDFSDAFRFRKE